MKKKFVFVGLVLIIGLVLFGVDLRQAVAQADVTTDVPVHQIIIKYKAEANLNEMAQAQASVQMARLNDAADVTLDYFRPMSGEAHVLKLPTMMSVDEALQITARLSALPEVEYAEPDYVMFPIGDPSEALLVTPNDTYYGYQWHYFDIYGVDAPAAWDITTGSSSVYVAVLDTGILNHEDLNGRWTGGYDFITDPAMANDGGGRDADPHDPGDWVAANECGYPHNAQISSWHGTHVGGTIGAATHNSTGVAGLNWVSPIVPVRVLGKCGGLTSDIADGIRWAAGLSVAGAPSNPNPAQVINMSLGGQGDCSSTYQNAIDAAYGAGTAIVVAAGNNNQDAIDFRPANCNNVITVAATDRNGYRAPYSNFGSVVEISAPGGDTSTGSNGENGVLSTLNDGVQGPGNDIYVYYQGTSMAAPHVAGVASLLYSQNPALTPAQVMAILQDTVTAFPAGSTCNTSNCGSGIVNAAAALASAVPLEAPVLDAISNPDGDGNYTVNWNDVTGATGYTLQVDDNSSFLSPTTAYSGAASQYNVSGQMPGMWYYRVRATNGSGSSDWSNTVSVAVQPPAPTLDPIINLGDTDAYTITWSASAGADGYLLQEALTDTFAGATTRYMGANTEFIVTGQAGGAWYYRVNAYADSVDSDWSNTVTTTVTTSYLDAPILAPIDNVDEDSDYTVQWSDVTSATSYILEESDNPYFVNSLVVYSGALTQTAIIEQDDGTWYYRVRAADSVEKGPWSNSESAVVAETYAIYLPLIFKNLIDISNLPTEFTSTADTTVIEGYPNENYGNFIDMAAGYDEILDPYGRILRSLVQFDLSVIPSYATVNQATLNLFLYSSWDFDGSTRTITTYRLGSPWAEMAVNWYTQPTILEAYGSAPVTHGQWMYYSFDVTALVQGWINGAFPNYGLAVRGPEHSGFDASWKTFFTRESWTPDYYYPPYLQISYGAATSAQVRAPVVDFDPILGGPSLMNFFNAQPTGEKEFLQFGVSE